MRSGVVCLNGCLWSRMPYFFEVFPHWDCHFLIQKCPPNSSSAADDMAFLMIVEILSTTPFFGGEGVQCCLTENVPPVVLLALASDK